MKDNEKNQIAFTDFKSSITISEFESVLEIANEEYSKLARVAKSKVKFEKKCEDSIKQIKSQAGNMPPGLLEKLIEGLERRANKDVLNQFSNEIIRHKAVTDFLNRFRQSDDELQYLDLTIKEKTYGNI
tara:strand:+ start:18494 stop:18880 length:387 start_codon:yes stop_codon:yes gene_type:complete